ncbi:MAG: hypothetical protein MUO34_13175, partial [Ignavibacteriaceae bacterium]|nr:hypothetical protein [Ignavibacteriaceae bacterium]
IEIGEFYVAYFPKEIKIGKLDVPKPKKLKFPFPPGKIFFAVENLVLKKTKAALVFFTIPKPQNISFSNKLLQSDEETVRKNFLIEIITQITPYNFTISQGSAKQFKLRFSETEIKQIDLLVKSPAIENKLTELVPEVYEIELFNKNFLSKENLIDLTEYITDISELPFPEVKRFMIPGIDDLSTHVISYKPERIQPSKISEVKVSKEFRIAISKSPKMNFRKTATKVLRFTQTDASATKVYNPLEDRSTSLMDRKLFKHILVGNVKATWEKTRKVIPSLLPYQEEGAKFLVDNNFVIMAEEPGSDKQLQAVGAIKFLFSTAQIKSALIIIKNTQLGSIEHSKKFRLQEGFLGRLVEYAPEISLNVISSASKSKKNKQSAITIISYDNNDELQNLLKTTSSDKGYDLLVIDEFTNSFNSDKEIENLFKHFYPDHFWLLTGKVDKDKFNDYFKDHYLPEGNNWKYFIRTYKELAEKLPSIKYEDIWFEPEPEQVEELNQLIDANRDELKQVIESLNPFKFHSTLFSLIHKLKQIENFSAANFESPKSKFLLDQLKITSANNRKTLLFTQYDNLGLKRLEKILEKNKLQYLSVQNGSSPEDLKRALNLFNTRDDYPIFMTNLKPARLKVNLNKINYIINFDQWWNPSSFWQMEEELGLGNYNGQQIVFYNYFMANSFDEVINEVLERKGLNNKEAFSELSGESLAELISEYDWQNIFELSMNIPDGSENVNFIRTSLAKISVDDFIDLMKRMFMRLGYRDIEVIELQDEPAFYILGRTGKLRSTVEFRAKCILAKNVSAKDWQDILERVPNKTRFERLFVISNGTIKKTETNLNQKINLIYGERLVELINMLNIISKDSIKLRKLD